LSKVQGFKFVSKTIYNKPYTTNQKPKKLKQKKRTKDMLEISKRKILTEKIQFFNSQLSTTPTSYKKECRGVVQDSSMNNNTPIVIT
jgi:hypothetical protein